MEVHTKIDVFTDSHEIVKRSKARLVGKRYLKGVVIDMIYDHFLTKHWSKFLSTPKVAVLNDFYKNAEAIIDTYPLEAPIFIGNLIASDRLNRYEKLSDVKATFERVDRRLSNKLRAKESCSSYFPLIEEHYTDLENDFLEFFPQLERYVLSL